MRSGVENPMRRVAVRGFCALLTLAAAAAPLGAQSAAAEAGIHTVTVGDARLSELVVPVALSWRLSSVRFDVNTAWAYAVYEDEGATSEIEGLTDVTVRLMVPLLRDQARLIVAGNVPTGTKTLTTTELPVAAALTTDLLALPIRSFGTGAGLTTGLALARPVGDWVAGGIAAYRVGSGYEPVVAGQGSQATEFRPGSELRLRLALERPAPAGVTVRFAGSWSRFGEDRTQEEAVFARGDRFMGEAVAEFPFRAGAATVYGWNLYRSGSRMLLDAEPQPVPSSTLMGLGAGASYPLTRSLSVRPRLEMTLQRGGEAGLGGGEGWIARAGSGVTYRFGRLTVEPAALIQAGALNSEDVLGVILRAGVLWQR